ncbi:sugar kinase [Streptomyces sp. 15-116A]|uniref:sugar kinase n=1 Tax=Streptomyces sp. 15-116A TaxID=2259035 RepID=UPI0021B2775B|nr:sugar kinase [Streptomyces sp. 15-116A]MCT7351161.1 sugar kinase [Streptomyces sp. 15-116A]
MTVTGPPDAPGGVDVVALGESMVTFVPSAPGRLADVPSFDRGIGGAESNTACMLAAAGHSVRWISRVGADAFGDHLVRAIGAYGVDVSSVDRDPARPTGIYFRTAGDRASDAHEVAYYRAGSAASAMTPGNVDVDAALAGRILHLSGITPALSDGCRDLVRALTAPRPARPLISFDVNYRAGLWGDRDGSRTLLDLARAADIVFVGEDEAEEAWGLRGARAVREALPEPGLLVVKQGRGGAVVLDRDPGDCEDAHGTATHVPAPRVEVTAAVGAGDAFAAGFLSAALRGLPVRERVRYGHLFAAAALTDPGDLAPPPAAALADRLAALDDAAWGRLRLGPGWTTAMERADEEVRTP